MKVSFLALFGSRGSFNGMPHPTPDVNFVSKQDGQLKVVIGGRMSPGVSVVRPVLRFPAPACRSTSAHRGEKIRV
jgi:hypothetical protein